MMRPVLSPKAAAELIPDGAILMIGGFMGVGSPHRILTALAARKVQDLTLIVNDTARPGIGVGQLISAGCVTKIVVSHIGTNSETQSQMLSGKLKVELVPQGTLAERIRAGGAGLGGVLTETGLGTLAVEGQQIIQVAGKDYLIATAIRADFALVAARSADYARNLVYSLTARNFNPLMAMAANLVIAETNEIVPLGVLAPDAIHTPGVLINHLIERPLQA